MGRAEKDRKVTKIRDKRKNPEKSSLSKDFLPESSLKTGKLTFLIHSTLISIRLIGKIKNWNILTYFSRLSNIFLPCGNTCNAIINPKAKNRYQNHFVLLAKKKFLLFKIS